MRVELRLLFARVLQLFDGKRGIHCKPISDLILQPSLSASAASYKQNIYFINQSIIQVCQPRPTDRSQQDYHPMTKFQEHMALVTGLFPSFDGLTGFFFYSFATYLVVLFFGWLLNPTVDKIIQDDLKQETIKSKGQAARQRNIQAQKEADAKAASIKAGKKERAD